MQSDLDTIRLPEKVVEGPDEAGIVTEIEYKMEDGNAYEIITKREVASKTLKVPEAVAERMKIKPISKHTVAPEVNYISLNARAEPPKVKQNTALCRICGAPHITNSCKFASKYNCNTSEGTLGTLESEYDKGFNDPSIRITGIYDRDVDEDYLKWVVKQASGIEATRANVLRDRITGEPRGMAFMNFETEEEAEKVLECFKEGLLLTEKKVCLSFEKSRK